MNLCLRRPKVDAGQIQFFLQENYRWMLGGKQQLPPMDWLRGTDFSFYRFEIPLLGLAPPSDLDVLEDKINTGLNPLGWLLQVEEGHMKLASKDYAELGEWVYHTTPSENLPGISELGLLPGKTCGKKTSGWKSAAKHIHVFLSLDDAREYAETRFLGKRKDIEDWAIVLVSRDGILQGAFRDPFSQTTGYILDVKYVPREFLRVAEQVKAK